MSNWNRGLVFAVALLPWSTAAAGEGADANKAGVAIKVITTRDCKLYEKPDKASAPSPVGPFKFFYVLPPDKDSKSRKQAHIGESTKEVFYRVAAGDSESEFRGWMSEDDVVEWHHRQAVHFSPLAGRELAKLFTNDDAAVRAAEPGAAGDDAMWREPASSDGNLILMPLLQAKPTEVKDTEMQQFEVALMAARPGGAAAPPSPSIGPKKEGAPGTKEEIVKSATTDIVLVVDSTATMKPAIGQVIKSIESVTASLAGNELLRGRLRFGLVAYRDTIADMSPSGLEYLKKVFCTLEEGQNHAKFLEGLRSVTAANDGIDDWAADVVAGLAKAMNPVELEWDSAAWKQIVHVGDVSAKGDDQPVEASRRNEAGRSIASVLTMAQPDGGTDFVFSTVHVLSSDAGDDLDLASGQFKTLSMGHAYRGESFSVPTGTDSSSDLTKWVVETCASFERFLWSPIDPSAGDADSVGASAGTPCPLLALIAAAPSGASAADVGMCFACGHCIECDAKGSRQFVPYVCVHRGELRSFNAILEYLQGQLEDAGEPGSSDVGNVVKNMQVVATGINLDQPITPDMPIEKFLQVLLGFPLKSPIFKVTVQHLSAMSRADYDDCVNFMNACTDRLTAFLESTSIWSCLGPAANEPEELAFIPIADLL